MHKTEFLHQPSDSPRVIIQKTWRGVQCGLKGGKWTSGE